MFTYIKSAVIVIIGHGQALRWANRGAQPTEHALAHINIELLRVDPLRGTIGRLTKNLRRSDGLDFNAIHRANLCAFVTDDAVVNFIVEFVAAIVRHGDGLVRELKRGCSLICGEKICITNILFPLFGHLEHMTKG